MTKLRDQQVQFIKLVFQNAWGHMPPGETDKVASRHDSKVYTQHNLRLPLCNKHKIYTGETDQVMLIDPISIKESCRSSNSKGRFLYPLKTQLA